MLKLITQAPDVPATGLTNLNTSHVKVNHYVLIIEQLDLIYLNTSHVKVNLIYRHYSISKHNHLNTSHVKVNLIGYLWLTIYIIKFKYISC